MRSHRPPSWPHAFGEPDHRLSRRQFLCILGMTAAGMVAAGCLPDIPLAPVADPVHVPPLATVPVSAHPVVAVAQTAS